MKDTKIQKIETTAPAFNIETLISQAVAKDISVESLSRLLDMRKTLKDEWAKEQFNNALAALQGEIPTIEKTKSVKTNSGKVAYKYAPIESIINQVRPTLQKYGFSYSTNMEIIENGTTKIKAMVKVIHKAGHSEITEMTVPLGNKTDIMSNTQVVAAAQTFAKRYAFCNAFGILTGEDDNEMTLNQKEIKELENKYIEKINGAKTLDELAKVGAEIKKNIKPDFAESLRNHYARRKSEIETAEDINAKEAEVLK
ncbi:MAG TPA: ERF family protein [Clostridia bacterium]